MARKVYALHGAVTDAAIRDLIDHADDGGALGDLQALAARLLLDAERRNLNKPVYAKAQALTERLTVEAPPAGYRSSATAPRASLESVMTGDDQGRGYTGRRPVAALRAFLSVTIKVEGKVVRPGQLLRNQMIPYAEQLERQGRGCMEHAAMMRDLWAVTRDGERGLAAVKRLESVA